MSKSTDCSGGTSIACCDVDGCVVDTCVVVVGCVVVACTEDNCVVATSVYVVVCGCTVATIELDCLLSTILITPLPAPGIFTSCDAITGCTGVYGSPHLDNGLMSVLNSLGIISPGLINGGIGGIINLARPASYVADGALANLICSFATQYSPGCVGNGTTL